MSPFELWYDSADGLQRTLEVFAVDAFGRPLVWLWTKSCRLTVIGEPEYLAVRRAGKAVVHMMWHGKIFIVPYFFRKRNVMPLVSPSRDGEIAARIMEKWGYKLLRGSGTHFMKNAWLDLKSEAPGRRRGHHLPDGPRGPTAS